MARFVILEHDHPQGRHWDLMVETGPALATWSLAAPPHAGTVTVQSLPDHRRAYLDYEGPISGGRGSVTQWDRGTCEIEEHSADRLVAVLRGQRLAGRVILVRLSDDSSNWQLSLVPSEPGEK